MWAFFSRRLRMWLLFTVIIPFVRRLWGRAQANRVAQRAQPAPQSAQLPAGSPQDTRTL